MADGIDVFFPLAGPDAGPPPLVRCLHNGSAQPDTPIAQVFGGDGATRRLVAALGAARERAPRLRGRPVVVRFKFANGQAAEGDSHQLAVALADRMLLEGAAGRPGRVFATGRIDPAGDGDILEIEGFTDKVRHVLSAVGEEEHGDVFAFPRANDVGADPEAAAGLDLLRRRGVLVCSATHIEELGFLWRTAADVPTHASPPATPARAAGAAASPSALAYGGLAGAAIVALWLTLALVLS